MVRKCCLGLLIVYMLAMNTVSFAKRDPYVELPTTDWGGIDAPQSVWNSDAAATHYGRLEAGSDIDAFAFTFDEPHSDWSFSVVVPVCGPYFNDVYPSAALIGVGLPAAPDDLPFSVPDGMGVEVFAPEVVTSSARPRGENEVALETYAAPQFTATIPQAGTYTLALWEPSGKLGAYALSSGSQHDQFAPRTNAEIDSAFDAVFSGEWMGFDCSQPPAVVCPPTDSHGGAADIPQVELRAKVGEGFVLSGTVRDAATCQPIVGAKVTFWLVNEEGLYDDAHQGALLTEVDGTYHITSNRPVPYAEEGGPPAHIHIAVTVDGFEAVVTEYIWHAADVKGADFPVVMRPSA